MELKLLQFIKDNPMTWRDILSKKPYCVEIKEDGDYILLKYNQIESDFNNIIVRECRGIILRKDNYKVVCFPFVKFGNYGEGYCPNMDWNSARVLEKVDGSIIKIFYDQNNWNISTNGTINAFKATCSNGESFGQLFEEIIEMKVNEWCNKLELNKDFTYMFEMTHPLTKIVISYPPGIYHIGTRDNITYAEMDIDINVKKPKEYSFNGIDKLVETCKTLPYSEEGYVVVDKHWNRVKVKSPAYVAVHHLKNNGVVSAKRLLVLVMQGETVEFKTYFPELSKYVDKVEHAWYNFIVKVKEDIEKIKVLKFETRKDYAIRVKGLLCSGFYFMVYDNKYSWDQIDLYLKSLRVDAIATMLKLKDEVTEKYIKGESEE